MSTKEAVQTEEIKNNITEKLRAILKSLNIGEKILDGERVIKFKQRNDFDTSIDIR